MKEIVHKSAVPIYLTAAVWILYCVIFPVYKLWHFAVLIVVTVLAYELFAKLFPGTKEYVEVPPEPVSTGDEQIDALLEVGRGSVAELKALRRDIKAQDICAKTDRLIELTGKIFDDLLEDKNDYKQIKRFSEYFLPTTIKLLGQYRDLERLGVSGENTTGTMERIGGVLDTTILAYEKQLDALFADQALDIETDIDVLKTMMKKEGLAEKDF
ncbi:MAG: 5-bromo-4-chloroindolyl phosphate hydrolysis family protein [Oscillospiraceae bacterium]|nr:5-bromo-4-chloroindolyl phosphate hydrolysis family protein [Oscillospiraceae bacterium]